MTCDLPSLVNKIQKHPCTPEATDRNWDALVEIVNKLIERDDNLQACFTEPIVTAAGLTPFKLTATLAKGGTANAVKSSRSGGAWVDGDAIVVKDAWPCGQFWGVSGRMGLAYKDTGTNEYIVAWIQTNARWIRYTLTATLEEDNATATVNSYWDGCDPGATVTVYDPNRIYSGFHMGGMKGVAFYNDTAERYEIQEAECVAAYLSANITSSLCLTADPREIPELNPLMNFDSVDAIPQGMFKHPPKIYSGGSWVDITTIDEGALPAGVYQIINPYNHLCPADSEVLLQVKRVFPVGTAAKLTLVIVDVKKQRRAFITDVYRQNDDPNPCNIHFPAIDVMVETCDTLLVLDAEPTLEMQTVDIPSSFEIVHGASPQTCSIVAHTDRWCVLAPLAVLSGDDITVATMTKREALIDVFYDDTTHKLRGETEYLWVPCYDTGVYVDLHTMVNGDYCKEFTTTYTASPEGLVTTVTKDRVYAFEIDAVAAGTVITWQKWECLVDIDVDSDSMDQDSDYHWIIRRDAGNTVPVVTVEACPE